MGVIDRTYTADEIKKRFTRRAYFDGHIIASESEYLMKPDLFTISRDLKTNEYEIKVSLSDLRKELLYIETVIEDHRNGLDFGDADPMSQWTNEAIRKLNGERKISTYDNKYRKHRLYLFGEKPLLSSGHRPNRFYFLIPDFLYQLEKARIDAIPYYGVADALNFYSLKRCRPMHKGTIDATTIWYAAQNIQGRHLNAEVAS